MSFGNILLLSSSVAFGAAFLLKIDASRKLINKFSENRANDAALNSFLGSISSFHDRNRKGCMQFYFSNAALLVSGFVYDGSAITKIFGLCAFGASLYTLLGLKDAFQASRPWTERAGDAVTEATGNVKRNVSRAAAKVNDLLDDDDDDRATTTTTTTTTTTGFRRVASKVNRRIDDAVDTAEGLLDDAEEALQNSAFGRATDAIEEVFSNLSEGVGSLFTGKSTSSKKGGARR